MKLWQFPNKCEDSFLGTEKVQGVGPISQFADWDDQDFCNFATLNGNICQIVG